MAIHWINFRLDAIVMGGVMLLMTWAAHRWLSRRDGDRGLPRIVWLGMAFFVSASTGVAELSSQRDDQRVRVMLEAFAPTYARELESRGHAAHRTGETSHRERTLDETRHRWLNANSGIIDLYTLRREGDDVVVCLGGNAGAHYKLPDDRELSKAFNGGSGFLARPHGPPDSPRVSAFAPLYDAAGHVDAVLGLDCDAASTFREKAWNRAGAMGMVLTIAVAYLAAACLTVTARNESERQLQAALIDKLTGLPNRQLVTDRINAALNRLRRDSSHTFAVLFLDFDRFKLINDSLGHDAGDALLSALADRLRAATRVGDCVGRGDVAARLGGDEFVLLLEHLGGPENAIAAADRLLRVLDRPVTLAGQEVRLSASIGIAIGDLRYSSAAELMRDADIAMYRAKAAGRARFAIFDERMHAAAVRRLDMESALRRAVETESLGIAYQPIVRLSDGQPCGFEALVRWTNNGTPVSPAEFIPLAEETGLVVQLGEWVLKTAIRHAASTAMVCGRPLAMNVNVSRRQLQSGDLPKTVIDILAETNFPPELLKLEITESAIMEDPDAARRVMSQLRAIGVQLQIDDFGTGYSSLGALSHFPITGIKLDRSFIQEMQDDSRPAAIVRALLQLASDLNLDCVAEGLETIEQVEALKALQCPFGQGYYFARPLPADAAARLAALQLAA